MTISEGSLSALPRVALGHRPPAEAAMTARSRWHEAQKPPSAWTAQASGRAAALPQVPGAPGAEVAHAAEGGDQPAHGRTSVTVASAAIPSSRPVKPSRSEVVALTETGRPDPQKPASDCMSAACGPIFGRSQISVRSTWVIGSPSPASSHGVGQEDVAVRALPLRVGGREMRADIALGQRAVDRVGDGVQPHIGVGMALQPALMRHPRRRA
jgi:hypothetical protein